MKNIAPISLRILSGIIDFLIFLLPFFTIVFYVSESDELAQLLDRLLFSIIIFLVLLPVIFPLFSAWLITTLGGTIGKLATNTQIINTKGKTLTFWQALLRNYIGYMVSGSFVWLGFIWIAIDKERRGWHDMIADTYVVIKNQNGLITGLLVTILLGIVNFILLSNSIRNFQSQVPYYQGIVRDFTEARIQKDQLNQKLSSLKYGLAQPGNTYVSRLFTVTHPPTYSRNTQVSNCLLLSKEDIHISIGDPETTGCFPSGVGRIIAQETLNTYTFSANDISYPLRDVKLTMDDEVEVWGMIVREGLYWFTFQYPSGEKVSVFYALPEAVYENSISEIRSIVNSIVFTKSGSIQQ